MQIEFKFPAHPFLCPFLARSLAFQLTPQKKTRKQIDFPKVFNNLWVENQRIVFACVRMCAIFGWQLYIRTNTFIIIIVVAGVVLSSSRSSIYSL